MIKVFECTEEKDRKGHPKKIYAVTGVKTRDAALNEVAKYKKKSLVNIKLTHSARVAMMNDNALWWDKDIAPENKDEYERCWAVRIKNEVVE